MGKESKPKRLKLDLILPIVWIAIYTVLYWLFGILLEEALGNYDFFDVQILYLLVMGLCFSVSSRIIYSLMKKDRIQMSSEVFFFWTFAYGLSIGLFEFLNDVLIKRSQVPMASNYYFNLLFIGIGVWACICLIRKMDFDGFGSRKRIRAPSQILTGVLLMIGGILSWRFSTLVFINWLNWGEGMAWSLFIGFALIITGFLVLVAWWRNNVLQHRIGVKFGHWN